MAKTNADTELDAKTAKAYADLGVETDQKAKPKTAKKPDVPEKDSWGISTGKMAKPNKSQVTEEDNDGGLMHVPGVKDLRDWGSGYQVLHPTGNDQAGPGDQAQAPVRGNEQTGSYYRNAKSEELDD
jgi:hypothetical protein